METVRVKKGQFVSQGNIIGTIGSTGLSTGAHLHYEVHIDSAKYVNVKASGFTRIDGDIEVIGRIMIGDKTYSRRSGRL